LALAALLLSAVPVRAGRLDAFKKQFRGNDVGPATDSALRAIDRTSSVSTGSSVELLALILAIPFAYSLDLGDEGYARFPYEPGASGDCGDRPHSLRFGGYYHRVGDGVGGTGGFWRLDSERHVGLEVFWTHYRERGEQDLSHLAASAHGDLYRDERGRVDYQLGLAALSGRLTRIGPRLALEGETYPLKPLFFDAHAAASFIDGGPLGEMRAGGGVIWDRFSLRVGYRALIGPFKTLDGPDAGLTVRF
jgi:hypothetical protein